MSERQLNIKGRNIYSPLTFSNMTEKEHYLYISSEDSRIQRPDNTSTEFTVELPRTYLLDGTWECSLKEFSTTLTEDLIYVCTNICQESYVENTLYPVLRAIDNSKTRKRAGMTNFTFADPFYVKVKIDVMNRLTLFIRGPELKPPKGSNGIVRCTLHLRKSWI